MVTFKINRSKGNTLDLIVFLKKRTFATISYCGKLILFPSSLHPSSEMINATVDAESISRKDNLSGNTSEGLFVVFV